jgi:uncharacterized protein (DUF1778 family)
MSPIVSEKPPIARARKAQSETSISMRISRHALDLIDDAAVLLGKSRTEFVLESARRHAIDVLLDQRLFVLGEDQHEAFMRALDNPPAPSVRLKQLMRAKAPWDR